MGGGHKEPSLETCATREGRPGGSPLRSLPKKEAGQSWPVGYFQEGMRSAVPGLGEEDGDDAVFG